jgi:hypothetical protein
MAIAFDKVLDEQFTGFTNSVYSFNIANGPAAAGNLVVVGLFHSNTGTDILSVTDARGNTYVLSSPYLIGDVQNPMYSRMAYSILTTALQANDQVSINYDDATFKNMYSLMVSYSGLAATPLDQQGTAQDNAFPQTQPVGPSLTTTVDNELLVTFMVSANSGRAFTPTTGWTKRDGGDGTQQPGLLYEDRIVSSIGTYQSAPTVSQDDYWNAHTMTFKAEVGVTLDTVLPDADVVTTGWATAPLYSKLNDGSDATVITATAS